MSKLKNKKNDAILKKQPHRLKDRRTDPILKTLLAITEDPTNTTPVDWHLKVKDTEYTLLVYPKIIASQMSCKKSAQFIIHSSGTADLRVPGTKWPHPILTLPT